MHSTQNFNLAHCQAVVVEAWNLGYRKALTDVCGFKMAGVCCMW